MSTFAKSSFNAVAYAASRPAYPPALYAHVLSYAHPLPSPVASRTVLDLGCGPGLSTFAFLPDFGTVIGLDPSANMVATANQLLEEKRGQGEVAPDQVVNFRVGSGESLESLKGQSVDLVVAGQAAHWFDARKVYAELRRVLKPGGSFVFWGYGEFYLPDHPKASKLIPPYSAGTLGPYWQQPGRSIVESLLIPFPLPAPSPSPKFTSLHRAFFSDAIPPLPPADPTTPYTTSLDPVLLTHKWSMTELGAYLGTFSAAHTYDEKNGKESDVARDFAMRLKEALASEGVKEGEKFKVAWRMGTVQGKLEG
ncbi:hypothetical protein RQP46_008070 [Phenoliferia psychrophenolica]